MLRSTCACSLSPPPRQLCPSDLRSLHHPCCCWACAAQVLAVEGAKPKGKDQPAKYDKAKAAGAAAGAAGLAAGTKAYNADTDVALGDGKKVRGS